MSSEPVASQSKAGSSDTLASSLADELASEKKKCQQIWQELVQVGTSWEAQADYIKTLESERARLNTALGEVYDSYRQLLQDLIDPESSRRPAGVVAERFSLHNKPTSLDVVLCFLIFYCRLPDSPKDIDHLLSRVEGRGDLLEAFFTARETRQLYPTLVPYRLSGHEPALAIEQVESPDTLKEFFENTKRVWSGFGDTEPHWSVITDNRYKAASIASRKTVSMRRESGMLRVS
jgi:hypothetical protein